MIKQAGPVARKVGAEKGEIACRVETDVGKGHIPAEGYMGVVLRGSGHEWYQAPVGILYRGHEELSFMKYGNRRKRIEIILLGSSHSD